MSGAANELGIAQKSIGFLGIAALTASALITVWAYAQALYNCDTAEARDLLLPMASTVVFAYVAVNIYKSAVHVDKLSDLLT